MKYKYNQEVFINTLTNWNINIKRELIPLKKLYHNNDNNTLGTVFRKEDNFIETRILIL